MVRSYLTHFVGMLRIVLNRERKTLLKSFDEWALKIFSFVEVLKFDLLQYKLTLEI